MEHSFFNALIAILAIAMCVAVMIMVYSGGQYKPGKSFFFWRMSKKKLQAIQIISLIITILLLVLFCFKSPKCIVYIVAFIVALYSWYYRFLSFKFHEDVDFVTNNKVADLLGMEIDEKVQASYQNFSTVPKSGSYMFLLTDRNVIFAYYNGNKWSILNRKLSDVRKIGKTGYSNTSYLYLGFSDRSSIGLHMTEGDKLTSNPTLFFKKFLEVFDTFLLGKTDRIIASRRRVSMNDAPHRQLNNLQPQVRTIDISSTIINNLRDAVQVEPGRVLEF